MIQLSDLVPVRKKHRLTVEEYFEKLTRKGLNEDGTPILDPVPLAPPIGYTKQPSMVELVRDMVRGERLKMEAQAAGAETFEEAEDFDIPDDPVDRTSPYENDFDPPLSELLKAGEEETKKKAAKKPQDQKSGGSGAEAPEVGGEKPPEPPKAP